ncbi:MAG: molybdopterin molybdotransferase MoeA [Alphaproteobacteria bacterium]|nr:molybdopterin molybdotransferase MoeA [Alphaproteobacteria bacterium]
MPKLTQFAEALEIIKHNTKCLQEETIPLEDSLNRVLSQDITATIANPNFNNSAVDGIGITKQTLLNLQKNNTPLQIKKTILAGDTLDNIELNDNECLHIMTGAIVPPQVSTIFLIEETTVSNNSVLINAELKDNQNIRNKGEDFNTGDILVNKFTKLKFNNISLLATSGIAEVFVFKKPRVAIFTTGKETVAVGNPLKSGQIYNSNIITMKLFLEKLGFEVITLDNVADDITSLEKNIAKAQKYFVDIIVSSGAVSMGTEDIIKHYLLANAKVLYNGLAIRPGKPNILAILKNNMLYFALPGNPVSTAVALNIFVQTYYNSANMLTPKSKTARAINDYSKKKDFTFFVRGRSFIENGELKVEILKKQGSHMLSSLSLANCLVKVNADTNTLEKNSLCEIYEIK